jgi:predicted ATP-dependent endonuclease of OLD family
MKIKEIQITGVGGIESVELEFNDQMNLICGPNGIGKTTIIETIAHIFSHGDTSILKRNVNFERSKVTCKVQTEQGVEDGEISFDTFLPEKRASIAGLHQLSDKLFSFKTTRTFSYMPLESVSKDTEKQQHSSYTEASKGINLTEIKNWFVSRYLYSAHSGTLTDEQLANFELAKKCFSLLNRSFSFSKVDASSNEIMVNTPSGEIYYEYLSSGFKSILSLSFGIIKEIEYRFKSPRIKAVDFDGIITIDEIELHLHPEWQGSIANVLSTLFPKVQFFATTHSPHIIQSASPNQIIALESIDNKVIQRELPETQYGFKGWSIEEVLTDVMGMKDTRTDLFNTILSDFGKFIDNEDYENAKEVYNQIDILLHPQNQLRKLLKFQLAEIKG